MASRQHGEMDSAELAIVIGGFSLFAIGLLSVLVVIVVNRRPATPVIAAAPIPPAAAQPVAASPSPYAPAAPAPPVQGNSTKATAGDLPDDESDESPDDASPSTITLQSPWPDDPRDRPGNAGVVGGESMGARLAREAEERRQAAREAREAERREREEERRRANDATQNGSGGQPPVPVPSPSGPSGPRFGPRFIPPPPPSRIVPQQPVYQPPASAEQHEYVVHWRGRQIPARGFGFMACFVGMCCIGYAGFATNASPGKRAGEFIFGAVAIGFGLICIIAPAILAR
jgi:hypothetical protein